MVITYRKTSEEEVYGLPEEIAQHSMRDSSSMGHDKLFRKMKKQIIDMENAMNTVNDILEKKDENEKKLEGIGKCLSFWKAGNNFPPVSGILVSKRPEKAPQKKVEDEVRER